MKMTGQRRVIARILSDAADHPDVEELYRRSVKVDSKISIATVYRTVRLFEEVGLLDRLDFGDGRARYEPSSDDHHDHLIDVKSGKVIEFQEEHVEELQRTVAKKLGYELVGHRMELYGIPLKGSD
ncbi:MAG: transcriptional repressor [Rhodospirillales bacterium]|nr:transcriptional repressor [Rhodospirillales bacterium]